MATAPPTTVDVTRDPPLRTTASLLDCLLTVQGLATDNPEFVRLTAQAIVDLVLRQVGDVAFSDFPVGGNVLRFFGSDGNWYFIDLAAIGAGGGTGTGTITPATFATINGNPIDNPLLRLALANKAERTEVGAKINDATVTSLTETLSAARVAALIAAGDAATMNQILGGVGPAYDTLGKIEKFFKDSPTAAAGFVAALATRLNFDAVQTLTPAQKALALSNLGLPADLLEQLKRIPNANGKTGDTWTWDGWKVLGTGTGGGTGGGGTPTDPTTPVDPTPITPEQEEALYQDLEATAKAVMLKIISYSAQLPQEDLTTTDELEYQALAAQAETLTAKIKTYSAQLP